MCSFILSDFSINMCICCNFVIYSAFINMNTVLYLFEKTERLTFNSIISILIVDFVDLKYILYLELVYDQNLKLTPI